MGVTGAGFGSDATRLRFKTAIPARNALADRTTLRRENGVMCLAPDFPTTVSAYRGALLRVFVQDEVPFDGTLILAISPTVNAAYLMISRICHTYFYDGGIDFVSQTSDSAANVKRPKAAQYVSVGRVGETWFLHADRHGCIADVAAMGILDVAEHDILRMAGHLQSFEKQIAVRPSRRRKKANGEANEALQCTT